jgi:ubiquinone/menaquinone biosynthesis C-methylase UbiE
MGPDALPGGPAGLRADVDWGTGSYEKTTAAELAPVARTVVAIAAARPGEHVLDLGCGSGNAALLAAGPGVRVTGLDPAARLLQVARARAAAEGKDIGFLAGRAESIPAPPGTVDVLVSVSVFGVIPLDPSAAAAEMARVLAPGGRIVFSAWCPGDACSQVSACAAEAVRQVLGTPPPPAPFPWHDRDALTGLVSPHGLRVVEVSRHSLQRSAPSARDYLDRHRRAHPQAVSAMRVLERAGLADPVRARLLDILETRNQSRHAFQVTSDYVVAVAQRETQRP